ncbi:phosphoribosyltransferase [Nautilia sp.]
MIKKYFYSYNEFIKDINTLAEGIKKLDPECIIAVARGGLTIAHFLGENLNIRDVYTINAIHYDDTKKLEEVKLFNFPDLSRIKKAVIVDDISDSGDTFEAIIDKLKKEYPELEIKIATLFYRKNTKVMPDICIKETDKWVVFFWDNEGQKLQRSDNE